MRKDKVLVLILIVFICLAGCVFKQKQERPQVNIIEVENTKQLITTLKEYGLWDLKDGNLSVVIKGLPPDFKNLKDLSLRRKIFIRTVLPAALVALNEVYQERQRLLHIVKKLGHPDNLCQIKNSQLNSNDRVFLQQLTKKYRSCSTLELLKRVNTVPLSLLLAQAAVESDWGTSRFALKGNNIFGIWTYKGNGLVPLNRDPGACHKVAKYASLLDAVRSYLYNLNVGWAYDDFRYVRQYTSDPFILAQYLDRYSQMGPIYAQKLKKVIVKYHLREYEKYACKNFENLKRLGYYTSNIDLVSKFMGR